MDNFQKVLFGTMKNGATMTTSDKLAKKEKGFIYHSQHEESDQLHLFTDSQSFLQHNIT